MDSFAEMFEKVDSAVKFKEGLIQEIMKLYMTDQKVRFTNEGIAGVELFLKAFLQETVWRTMNQANNEGMHSINLDHLEKILPQLVL